MSCVLSVILFLLPLGPSVDADVPSGFPVNECDCLIEFDDAGEIVNFTGTEELVPALLENLIGLPPHAAVQMRSLLADALLSSLLTRRSVFGMVNDGTGGDFEWIAWVPMEKSSFAELIPRLKPVRKVDRLVVPRINVSLSRCGDGMLLASEPPGSLRTQALAMIGSGVEPLPWSGSGDPLEITYRNDDRAAGLWFGEPGASRLGLRIEDKNLEVRYSGWSRDGLPKKPCCERLLDLAVLEGLPKDLIGVFVELPDTQIMPGAGFLQNLLPYMVDSERSDERWSRRVVVLGEMTSADGMAVPALAIAIESDGPGSTLRRQDISVLAALNSLRNRLGSQAGLQHLPKLRELPDAGQRTIYARALFDPVMAGHPFLKDFSINWCRASGVTDWELYATCPTLTSNLSGFFMGLSGSTRCVSASHVGRINSSKLSEHFSSLIQTAPEFVNALELPGFTAGVSLLYQLVRETDLIDWVVSIPDDGRVEATITVWPKEESEQSVD